MAQQVFSNDDLRKKILSYVVYDVYKCNLCGEKCSPLDSILYKQKYQDIEHFDDDDGGVYYKNYKFDDDALLCNSFTTKFYKSYRYRWLHKNCCNHFIMTGTHDIPVYNVLCNYIHNNNTPYSKLKKNGLVNKAGEDLITLIQDGNLLFKKHTNKKTQGKAEYFEKLMYKLLVDDMNEITKYHKENFENYEKKIEEKKQYLIKSKTIKFIRKIRPELFTKILIKKYQNKDINFKTFLKNMENINHKYKNFTHNLEIEIYDNNYELN